MNLLKRNPSRKRKKRKKTRGRRKRISIKKIKNVSRRNKRSLANCPLLSGHKLGMIFCSPSFKKQEYLERCLCNEKNILNLTS
jgi:hypothetical protein